MKYPLYAAFAFALASCGDDKPDMTVEPPPPEVPPSVAFTATDPCTAQVPQPTDLFRAADGIDAAALCTSGGDKIDAAIKAALADEGVALNTAITIPLTGNVDAATATSSSATILVKKTGTGTTATWTAINHTNQFSNMKITVVPSTPLEAASEYVVVLTDVVMTESDKPLAQHPAIKALVGNTVIGEGAYEGLDAATAARLERARLRLAPAVAALEIATPPLARTQIRSIQGFTTSIGFGRLQKIVDDYRKALTANTFPFHVDASIEITPADVYPVGTPASFYANVRAFKKGKIRVPKVLDDNLHLRADWATAPESTEVPFWLSLPSGGNYTVAIYLPGLFGSKQDIREIASSMAGAPRAAVFGIDLRCHGDRSPDATGVCKDDRTDQEVAALTDQNSNGNPERQGPDGVPDSSGSRFFPAEARALRDTQIASMIEVMHVIQTFQRGMTVLNGAGITPNAGEIHLVAHGQSATIGVLAAAYQQTTVRTLTLPAGGAGLPALIQSLPETEQTAFKMSLPNGIEAAMYSTYLTRLEDTVLQALDPEKIGMIVNMRYIMGTAGNGRVLLPHGDATQFVSTSARQTLIDTVGLAAAMRVSKHKGQCDDFYLHTCMIGEMPVYSERARDQIATFITSVGVTVLAPAL